MKILILLFLIILNFSCNAKKNEYIEIKKMKKYSEFVFLEGKYKANVKSTFKDIKDISSIIIKNNHIVISDKKNAIHLFNREGEYLESLRKNGKGPGEYEHIQQVLLFKNKILINDGYRGIINDYDIIDGKFVYSDDIDIANYKLSSPFFTIINNKIIATTDTRFKSDYRVHVFGENFDKLNEFSDDWTEAQASYEFCKSINKKYVILLDVMVFKNGNPRLNSNNIKIYNHSGKLLKVIKHNYSDLSEVHSDIEGDFVVAFDHKDMVYIYDPLKGKVITKMKFDLPIYKNKNISYLFEQNYFYAYYEENGYVNIDKYAVGKKR